MEAIEDKLPGKYFLLISVHGLLRGEDMELGRDADTGGQIKYVVELARALGADPRIDRVDLITRKIEDQRVAPGYAAREEVLAPGVRIVRLPCGPRRYLRKEMLWPHLDSLVDQITQYISTLGRIPDFIHSHYADAGYVGTRLASLLGVPLLHTGHSLGRVKRQRLQEKGDNAAALESEYNLVQRIEAEEQTLDAADLVVASTAQEVDEQYALYDKYNPRRMAVIPPGIELSRFHPPRRVFGRPAILHELERFLREPRKPMILALSRPDERKNITALVQAYAQHPTLRDIANLVVIAGNRDDLASMERGPRQVLSDLLIDIDRYDLYGKVAIPSTIRLTMYRNSIVLRPARAGSSSILR